MVTAGRGPSYCNPTRHSPLVRPVVTVATAASPWPDAHSDVTASGVPTRKDGRAGGLPVRRLVTIGGLRDHTAFAGQSSRYLS